MAAEHGHARVSATPPCSARVESDGEQPRRPPARRPRRSPRSRPAWRSRAAGRRCPMKAIAAERRRRASRRSRAPHPSAGGAPRRRATVADRRRPRAVASGGSVRLHASPPRRSGAAAPAGAAASAGARTPPARRSAQPSAISSAIRPAAAGPCRTPWSRTAPRAARAHARPPIRTGSPDPAALAICCCSSPVGGAAASTRSAPRCGALRAALVARRSELGAADHGAAVGVLVEVGGKLLERAVQLGLRVLAVQDAVLAAVADHARRGSRAPVPRAHGARSRASATARAIWVVRTSGHHVSGAALPNIGIALLANPRR